MEPSDYLSMRQNQQHLKVMEVLRRWDPIGVIDEDNLDEYDSYSFEVVRMLDRGAGVDELLNYMRSVVTDRMEMSVFDEPHSRACAEELVEYWRDGKAGRLP